MNGKTLLLTGALALSILGIANAKSYSIILSEAAKVGATTLKAGEYSVSVKGDQAVFHGDTQKDVTVSVKAEQGSTKFNNTALESSSKDGVVNINAIELGGSATRLVIQ